MPDEVTIHELHENWHALNDKKCAEMGALWNLLFPAERDSWDYPDQMYRLVFAQVAWMLEILKYYAEHSPDSYPAQVVIQAEAARAEYIDPKPYEWVNPKPYKRADQ